MCRLESALCTVRLERDFMRWSSVMWFWPFYHHVTDSRQVSPTTRSQANNGTFTFYYLWHCCEDTAFLAGNMVGDKFVGHWVQGATMIFVITSENISWVCSKFETSPVLLLIQLQPVSLGSLLMRGRTNWWPDISGLFNLALPKKYVGFGGFWEWNLH
jgi:hypothetical protein